MADVTFKSHNRTEQVTATGINAMLVLPAADGQLGIHVDIPNLRRDQALTILAAMGALVMSTLAEAGVLEMATALSREMIANGPTIHRVNGQPVDVRRPRLEP